VTKDEGKKVALRVEPEDCGGRIDVYISTKVPVEFSRSRVQSLIEEGLVKLDGSIVKKSATKVKAGQIIEIQAPPPQKWDVEPEPIPLKIVYEDDDILVVNKERGMVVHPAAGHRQGTLVNAILNHCPGISGIGGETRPGIVHRLDKDTTGLLVIAKNEISLRSLQRQIKERKVKRRYVALCKGRIKNDAGTIDAPIGRHPVNRKKMAVVSPGARGRNAVTDYEVVRRFGNDYTLTVAKLRTGRTHQIRVHFLYLGHPIVGDPVYSRSKGELGLCGQALHAYKLGLYRPQGSFTQGSTQEEYVEFFAPLPEDFKNALRTLEKKYGEELPKWLMI